MLAASRLRFIILSVAGASAEQASKQACWDVGYAAGYVSRPSLRGIQLHRKPLSLAFKDQGA